MIQRAQDAPRRAFEPPQDLGAGLVLLAVAGAARVVAGLLVGSWWIEDPRLATAAGHLAAGHGLALGPPAAPELTAALHPLAPWLLSLALRVSHGHALAEPGLAILAGALSCWAAAQLAAGLYGPTAGRAVGWSVALSPLLVASAVALEPSVFGLSVLLALGAGAAWLRTPRRGRAFGAGLLCGIATLASTPGVLLAPVILAWSWQPLGLTVPASERIRQAALLVLGLCAVVAPWTIRNAVALHEWAPVTSGGAFNMHAWSGQWLPRLEELWRAAPVPRPFVLAGIAWILLAVFGSVRILTGPRRWYQALPFVMLFALAVAALGTPQVTGARLGLEPLLALLAGIGALHARRALHLKRRGLRVVSGRAR